MTDETAALVARLRKHNDLDVFALIAAYEAEKKRADCAEQSEAELVQGANDLDLQIDDLKHKLDESRADRDASAVRADTLDRSLKAATGAFGEHYRRAFQEIYERLCASSDDPKLAADLMEERWNWEACANSLLIERDALAELLRRADTLVKYLAPAFTVLRTMMLTGNLRMGADKAREMQQEVDVFLADIEATLGSELDPSPSDQTG